jgi:transposase-like protein
MSKAKKRKFHTPEFKTKVAEALGGVKTINEISQEYGLYPISRAGQKAP